jgi:hypothetical protein
MTCVNRTFLEIYNKGFVFEGTQIYNPKLDETGKHKVNSLEYYDTPYIEWIFKLYQAMLDCFQARINKTYEYPETHSDLQSQLNHYSQIVWRNGDGCITPFEHNLALELIESHDEIINHAREISKEVKDLLC